MDARDGSLFSHGRRLLGVLAASSVAAAAGLCSAGSASAAVPAGAGDVVGGAPTSIEQWPWQVAIATPPASSGGSGYDRQRCGGSLVSPTAVLTAAHCVHDEGGFDSPGEVSIITGRRVLSSDAGAEIPASDVIYFADVGGVPTPQSVSEPAAGAPLYDESHQSWDVAIVELARPAPAPAAPIGIASPEERSLWEAGDTVYATGWGDTTGTGGNYPDDLRAVEMRVIADSDCGDFSSYGSSFSPDTMVCAGNPVAGGKDTCQGDSGGPLVAPAGDGTYRLIGDTSFGDGCGLPEKHGVYGRVADETMRPAIMAAIAQAVGGPAPASTEASDRRPPQTKLKQRPAKRTKKRVARFRWKSTENATFRCSIDGGPASICRSPFAKRVSPGRHSFAVTGRDRDGNVEKRAARYSWVVEKKKDKKSKGR